MGARKPVYYSNNYLKNLVVLNAFDMTLPGRNDQGTNDPKYGFQGQEMDDEVKGEGNLGQGIAQFEMND